MMDRRRVRAKAPARVGLAGNPSDAYGGGALSLAIANFSAEVEVHGSRTQEIAGNGAARVLEATIRRLTKEAGQIGDRCFSISCRTDIPREVGLGGSSAIVTAALRALVAFHQLDLRPAALPALALAVETEELGITAGPQDRVAQAFGGLIHVEATRYGGGHAGFEWEHLDANSLPPLFLAYLADAAGPSDWVHTSLRGRFDAGEGIVIEAMARLRVLAAQARRASLARDRPALARAMDRSFDARDSITALDPRHVAMIELAREHGAAANFAGSGGAIVGLPARDSDLEEIGRAFAGAGYAFEVCRPAPRQ